MIFQSEHITYLKPPITVLIWGHSKWHGSKYNVSTTDIPYHTLVTGHNQFGKI